MAVTILSMLKEIAALKGRESLDGTTDPTEEVALRFINEAILMTVGLLCPVRLGNNVRSAGALDKLKLITETDDVVDTVGVTTEPNKIAFPDSGDEPICYIAGVFIKCDSSSFYRANETDFGTLLTRKTGGNYPVTASSPLFAFCDGIYVVPGATTSQTARYHFIKKPATVAAGGSFPLDDDLVTVILDYVFSAVLARASDPESEEMAQFFLNKYLIQIQEIIGLGFQKEKQ